MTPKCVFLTCLFVLASFSAFAAERWQATSSTALSITGDLTISDHHITFGNGQSVELKPVGPRHPNTFVLNPPDPVLQSGQRLCGGNPPTFVQLVREGDSLYFKVFEGPSIPPPTRGISLAPGACALYNYERIAPSRSFSIYRGHDLYGGDYRQLPGKVAYQACLSACRDDSRCKAFTYNTRARACFLKSQVPQRSPFKNAISGVRAD